VKLVAGMTRKIRHVVVRHLLSFILINLFFHVIITRTYPVAYLYFNVGSNSRSFLPLFPVRFVSVLPANFFLITPIFLLDILPAP